MKTLKDKLSELFEVRNSLIASETIEEAAIRALEVARLRLRSQTAAVFLFAKSGLLERVAINGIDKDNLEFDNSWFSSESHQIGDSFTGKVIEINDSISNYGKPYWSNNLEKEGINPECKKIYKEKLGMLRCAIAVPLNGQHRTYGVLEVINKMDELGNVSSRPFSQDDIYWLSNIGINLAATISGIRRKTELNLLAQIGKLLLEPFGEEPNYEFTLDQIANMLIDKHLNYKVCIIRKQNLKGELITVARAGDEIQWEQRIDEPLHKGERLAGKVLDTGDLLIVQDIDKSGDQFKNYDWIKTNKLSSYICLPLSIRSKVVGTISLFTGYRYKFYASDISFLENVANLVAAFSESSNITNELREVRRELLREQEIKISSTRAISYQTFVQATLHNYKHDMLTIQRELQTALESSPNRRLQIIKNQLSDLRKYIDKVTQELDSSTRDDFQAVDINEVIQYQVRVFKLELRDSREHIEIITDLSNIVPLISARRDDFREIIFNLLSNSIKAVRSSNKKRGEIYITTDIINLDIPYIEITIEDNGIGIRNEIKDKVFDNGFTTYEDGTGVGLFVTRYIIVNVYGGQIEFESTVGKGTKFHVRIPKKRFEL